MLVAIAAASFSLQTFAGEGRLSDSTTVNYLLIKSKELIGSNPEQAIAYSTVAKRIADEIKFPKGAALALKNTGIVYYTQSKYTEAINYWTQSIEIFKSINDFVGISNILSNIGVIYHNQGDYEKALHNHFSSLKFAEQSGDKLRIETALNNIGGVYAMKPETYDKALYYYLKAHYLSEEINYDAGIGTTAVNIGEIYSAKGDSRLALEYFHKSQQAYERSNDVVSIPYTYNAIGKEYRKMGKYDLALKYHRDAYATAEKVERRQYMVQSLIGLASTYTAKGAPQSALNYYQRAEWLGKEINAFDELKDIYHGLSSSYASVNNFNRAFHYQLLYNDVKDTLYNIETDKKLTRMEFDFNLQKKEGEITLLTKDKTLRELELKRQKQAKYAFMGGLALLGVIAFILYRNYRTKVQINKVLDHQKDQIEGLLLNILPAEVAKELQETGTSTPRHYENVSVLFTDFKGFTSLADKMSPDELVEELSACFTAFDNIIEKHKLEKIKTIGDAYMCAGGIPVPDKDHPFRIVHAGMEIQDYILKNNLKRKSKGLPPWDIRIGIHAGPVVAGVVGRKKYAYDIWGSTVNIASRMESNSAPGQINISSAMYDIIKDKYVCSHRGKIHAKNVGEIDMYFLEHEIRIPVREFQPDSILQ